MVIISSAYKSEGWLPQIRSMFQTFKPEFFDATPLKPAYESVAPDPKYWRSFVIKMIEFDKKEYNLGEEKIKAIKVPVLLIMGDNDGIDMAHKASFYKMLGGDVSGDMAGLPKSQLAILPGSTHVSLMMKTDAILSLLKPFLTCKKINQFLKYKNQFYGKCKHLPEFRKKHRRSIQFLQECFWRRIFWRQDHAYGGGSFHPWSTTNA
jgi:hypothetical protein